MTPDLELSAKSSLFLLLGLVFSFSGVKGEIHCACTTPDCISRGKESCEAKYYCYVEFRLTGKQYLPTGRGCIDHVSPLNCAGFVPSDSDGPDPKWPVNYCCSDSWCNTVKHMNRQFGRKRKRPRKRLPIEPSEPLVPSLPSLPSAAAPPAPKAAEAQSRSSEALIAIPVVAAVLVLALIVLIIFFVKRQEARNRAMAVSKYYSVPASVTAGVKPVELPDNSCNYYEDNPIPLYASVGHKPAYPLCPVVPRTPV